MNNRWIAGGVALLALLTPGSAFAAKLAGLQVEIGPGVDALVREDIDEALGEALADVKSWEWVSPGRARASLDPVVRDCFTVDCLTKAGASLDADAGLRVRFSGESQIYDWTLEMFDLRDGALLESTQGACELCGRAEVVREFRRSVRDIAVATKLPSRRNTAQTTPKPTTDPSPAPPRTVAAETPDEPAPPVTTEAPAADLVLLEISVEPADAAIKIGGKQIGNGTAAVSLEAGTYQIQFVREGYRGLEETFVVGPDTSRRAFMRVHLSRTDPAVVASAPSEGPVDRLGRQRVVYGALGAGVGAAFLVAGAYLSYIDGRPTCDDGEIEACPTVYSTGGAAFVSTLTGAALATGGLALLAWELLAGSSEAPAATAVTPLFTPRGVGLSISGRF